MKRILILERELKLNKINLARIDGNNSIEAQKEFRVLVIQRANLKDMLLDEYRKELIEKRSDIEQLKEEGIYV